MITCIVSVDASALAAAAGGRGCASAAGARNSTTAAAARSTNTAVFMVATRRMVNDEYRST